MTRHPLATPRKRRISPILAARIRGVPTLTKLLQTANSFPPNTKIMSQDPSDFSESDRERAIKDIEFLYQNTPDTHPSRCPSDSSDSDGETNVIDHGPRGTDSSSQSERHPGGIPADQNFLMAADWTTKRLYYDNLEEQAFNEYEFPDPMREYRGGKWQTSCCYLLLDPRVTRDLRRSRSLLSDEERWERFLNGVFYVGQGKVSRPEKHFRGANDAWSSGNHVGHPSCTIRRILDIWTSGKGVICLQVFSRTMVEEACIREASMIDALDTSRLTNCNRGTYYGQAKTMSNEEKRSLGKYLLYKAMEILILDGEREIFPRSIRV